MDARPTVPERTLGEPDTPEEARTETAPEVRVLRKHDDPPPHAD